jgi:uncharacterized protein with FMN-binding domain
MRRILMWSMSTLTTMVLLFGYHTSTSGPQRTATSQVAGPLPDAVTSGRIDTSAGGAQQSTTGGSTKKSTGTSAGKSTTVAGTNISTRWGPVQVQITVTGTSVTAIDMLAYPSENSRDQEISARALPILISETLAAQSADIDMVSGATYTSDGYRRSLQAALDQAGI